MSQFNEGQTLPPESKPVKILTPEEKQTESIHNAKSVIGVLGEVLSTAIDCEITDSQKLELDKLGKLLDGVDIVNARLTARIPGDKDRIKIREGGDPGIYYLCECADGSYLHINIYGGIRNPDAPMDLKDSTRNYTTGNGHADRTSDFVDQPTHIGLNRTINGLPTNNCWVKYFQQANYPLSVYGFGSGEPVFMIPETGHVVGKKMHNLITQACSLR